jgi:integrase
MRESLLLSECAVIASGRISKKRPRVVASTKKWYENSMHRLAEIVGDMRLDVVTAAHLDHFQDEIEDLVTLSPATRNNYKRGVAGVFSRLEAMGHQVPPVNFDYEEETKGVKRVSDSNHHKLMAATGVRDALLVKWVYEGGARVGGLNSMRISTTHCWLTEDGELHVAARAWEKGRRHKKEQIYYGLHSTGLLLCSWLEIRANLLHVLKVPDHDMLFVNTLTGKPISTEYISGIFWKLKQAAKIPQNEPANAHAARHAFAITRLKDGMPLNVVSKLLGHSDIKTTSENYVRLQQQDLQEFYFGEESGRVEDRAIKRLFARGDEE